MRCGGFTVADNQIISYLITRYNQLDNGMATFQNKISCHFYEGEYEMDCFCILIEEYVGSLIKLIRIYLYENCIEN